MYGNTLARHPNDVFFLPSVYLSSNSQTRYNRINMQYQDEVSLYHILLYKMGLHIPNRLRIQSKLIPKHQAGTLEGGACGSPRALVDAAYHYTKQPPPFYNVLWCISELFPYVPSVRMCCEGKDCFIRELFVR